MKIGSKKAK